MGSTGVDPLTAVLGGGDPIVPLVGSVVSVSLAPAECARRRVCAAVARRAGVVRADPIAVTRRSRSGLPPAQRSGVSESKWLARHFRDAALGESADALAVWYAQRPGLLEDEAHEAEAAAAEADAA